MAPNYMTVGAYDVGAVTLHFAAVPDQVRAQNSQSPIDAEDGAMIVHHALAAAG
jgi:hypothetical protein